jgi:hypothetical protein
MSEREQQRPLNHVVNVILHSHAPPNETAHGFQMWRQKLVEGLCGHCF